MADGRTSMAGGFKAGSGGKQGEEGQGGKGESTLVRGGVFQTESAGLSDGVSVREAMSPADSDPAMDYQTDPLTGNATERLKPHTGESVSSKGKSFTIV